MAISNELYQVETIGDGSTPSIPFNRKVFEAAHVKGVSVTNGVQTTLVNGVDFTVTGAGDTSTGVTITPASAIATGTTWYNYTDQGPLQGTLYISGAGFEAKAHEYALDKLAIAIQETQGAASNPDGFFPDGRPDTVRTFDENGDPELIPITNFVLSTASSIRIDATTAATLVIADAFNILEMTNASDNDVTIPPNSSVPFVVGTRIDIMQIGAGLTTILAGAGVTINGDAVSYGQNKGFTVYQRAIDEWQIIGGTTA